MNGEMSSGNGSPTAIAVWHGESLPLFDGFAPPLTDDDEPRPISADRRRTQRAKDRIAAGVHPLRGGTIADDDGQTCGDCAHRVLIGHHSKSYPKCELVGITHGAGTDCRAWWPACPSFEAKS